MCEWAWYSPLPGVGDCTRLPVATEGPPLTVKL